MELQGVITEQGKMQVFNQPALKQFIAGNPGKQIILSLKIKRAKRSVPQNAYYWGVVIPLITEAINKLGNEFNDNDTHEFLKAKFNYIQIEVNDGHYLDIPQSTAKLDTKEFMGYLDKIYQFAAQMLKLYIPAPNEQLLIDQFINE